MGQIFGRVDVLLVGKDPVQCSVCYRDIHSERVRSLIRFKQEQVYNISLSVVVSVVVSTPFSFLLYFVVVFRGFNW